MSTPRTAARKSSPSTKPNISAKPNSGRRASGKILMTSNARPDSIESVQHGCPSGAQATGNSSIIRFFCEKKKLARPQWPSGRSAYAEAMATSHTLIGMRSTSGAGVAMGMAHPRLSRARREATARFRCTAPLLRRLNSSRRVAGVGACSKAQCHSARRQRLGG
jgi:hypothetical protein